MTVSVAEHRDSHTMVGQPVKDGGRDGYFSEEVSPFINASSHPKSNCCTCESLAELFADVGEAVKHRAQLHHGPVFSGADGFGCEIELDGQIANSRTIHI